MLLCPHSPVQEMVSDLHCIIMRASCLDMQISGHQGCSNAETSILLQRLPIVDRTPQLCQFNSTEGAVCYRHTRDDSSALRGCPMKVCLMSLLSCTGFWIPGSPLLRRAATQHSRVTATTLLPGARLAPTRAWPTRMTLLSSSSSLAPLPGRDPSLCAGSKPGYSFAASGLDSASRDLSSICDGSSGTSRTSRSF